MKFIISSSSLLKKLSLINGVITTNPVVPILENFLFEIDNGLLTLTASDIETTITTKMEIDCKEVGKIAIPSKILLETLRNLPDQPITFTIDSETYGVEINSDNGRYKLVGEHAMDFPMKSHEKDENTITMLSDTLSRAINNTICAASSDELRPAMTGVCFEFEENQTTIVSTDSHRLIRYKRTDITSNEQQSMIIPRKSLSLLKSILSTESIEVTIEYGRTNAFFSFEDVELTCRLINEQFPKYESVIPLNNTNEVIVNRAEILSTLKRIGIYSNKTTHQIKLSAIGNNVTIYTEDIDFSNEAKEQLACEHNGKDIEIGLNSKFLIEMIGILESESIKFQFDEPQKAALIVPTEQNKEEDLLHLIMPLMILNS